MKNILLIFFVFLVQSSFSQTVKADTSKSVVHFKNELITRVFTGVKNLNYTHGKKFFSSSDNLVQYDSPSTINLGVGVHTEFIGFHLWFNTGKVIDDDPKDDNREKLDFQANLYTPRTAYDLNLQHYKGLYSIENGEKDYQPKSEVFHIGGVMLYSTHDEYSLPSSFTQISKQLERKGSLLLFGGLSYTSIRLKHVLITDAEALGVSIGVGYGCNYIYKNWFVSAMIAGAPILQRNEKQGAKSTKVGLHFNARAGVGYNGEKWVYGVTFVDDSQVFQFFDSVDRLDKYHVKLFLGYRFGYNWQKHRLVKKVFK